MSQCLINKEAKTINYDFSTRLLNFCLFVVCVVFVFFCFCFLYWLLLKYITHTHVRVPDYYQWCELWIIYGSFETYVYVHMQLIIHVIDQWTKTLHGYSYLTAILQLLKRYHCCFNNKENPLLAKMSLFGFFRFPSNSSAMDVNQAQRLKLIQL
jgi:hypothetical protein